MGPRFNLFTLLLLALGPASARGQDLSLYTVPESRILAVAHSTSWLRLLHYRAPFLRSARSDVANPEFFLDPAGKIDPERELRATLRTFLETESARKLAGVIRQPAFCAFPARLDFLKRELGPEFTRSVVAVECPDFTAWRDGIAAQAVSLVYSSAYANNPASMFGHTFLRLDRKAGGAGEVLTKQMDFLSYGVNFSASVPDHENPVKYAMWGLFGGYLGRYDLAPYYRKVNEYAYSESRDLWEYRLSLNESETAQLVRHLWELYSGGFFRYYFLDENCSYQILALLEAVKPEWDLTSGFILTAIPIETVKHLTEKPGFVTDVTLRPSLRVQRERAESALSERERKRLRLLFTEKETPSESDSAAVLDALILSFNYEKNVRGDSEARILRMKNLLLLRSRLVRVRLATVERDPNAKPPELSHGTSRVSLTARNLNRGGRQRLAGELSISAFEHDFLNRIHSYNPYSELQLFRFSIEKSETEKFRLREARLIAMASAAPYTVYSPQMSWGVGLSWERPEDLPESRGGAWKVAGSYGVGHSVGLRRTLVFVEAAGEVETGSALRQAIRPSAGGVAGFLANPLEDLYFVHVSAQALHDFSGNSARRLCWRLELTQSLAFARRWDLRLGFARLSVSDGADRFMDRASLGVSYYF